MARKKQVKTPEQRLEEALVPREEQPYAVPDNWCWARLGACINKTTEKQTVCTSEDLYIGLENMESGKGIISYGDASSLKSDKAVFHPGQVLYGRLRPYLDKHDVAKVEGICSTDILVYDVNPCSDARYIDYLMSTSRFVRYASSCAKGVNLPRVSPADVERFAIPLPPLAEQRRIVERVEGLFAKLDEAENKIHDALDSARHWRISLLHSAFSGQLTRDWQGDRDLSDATWEARRFDEVAEIKQRLVDPADYPNLPHIAPDNIEKETGRLLQYRTVSEDGVISGKHRFYPGQIVYSKIRPYLSKVIIADFEGLCSADMYPIEAKIDTHYLWLYMLSQDFLAQTYDAGSRTVLPKINMKSLSAIRVPTPSIEEQKVIVDILMAALSRRNEAELLLNQALQRIGEMRSVVLAKALRGRLGTNETGDPSAQKELLAMFQSKVTRN